jgi:hypothetical protein
LEGVVAMAGAWKAPVDQVVGMAAEEGGYKGV